VDVDQFYGIEYEEFPARIAEVAMWLIDHQMNLRISEEFGMYYARLPLKKSAKIFHGNALQMNWNELIAKDQLEIQAENTILQVSEPLAEYEVKVKTNHLTIIDNRPHSELRRLEVNQFDYIIGNPPFIGSAYQNAFQKSDMASIFSGYNSFGMLDYVCAWYKKGAETCYKSKTKCAFVSTNSIAQGEQPGILWNILFNQYGIKIHFAHRTFKWSNEARGKAAVHVVIIGFASYDTNRKLIFEYNDVVGIPHEFKVKNINPYLVEGKDITLRSISYPLSNVPKMQSGSAARDGGFLILSQDEKEAFTSKFPVLEPIFKRFISGDDFLNDGSRWCIWLKNRSLTELREIKELQERFLAVKGFREASTRAGTKKMAQFPYLFAEERQPETDFLLIPKVSSENRKYIPIGYLSKDHIVSDKTFIVPNTTNFHFGVLTSFMHMSWMKYTCGRMKSDFSYSNTIVYNNFPWPKNPSEKNKKQVEEKAQKVLDVRLKYPDSSLADLYDPLLMPSDLVKAHNELDRAVDQCYRPQAFTTEMARIEYLFELYEEYLTPLLGKEKKGRKK
jgi:hypothetical protein